MEDPQAGPRGITVDPHAPVPRGTSPLASESSRASLESQPLSASSFSSSALFAWPSTSPTAPALPAEGPAYHNLVRERSDPFDRSTFAEDPFAQSASSSSSESGVDPPSFPIDERRGSVVFIPHHVRSTTDPLDPVSFEGDGYSSGGSGPPLDGYEPDHEGPPRFHRTFSAPLPNRVGFLRHPITGKGTDKEGSGTIRASSYGHRPSPLSTARLGAQTALPDVHTEDSLSTLSLELADSLQSAIQTLLHLSPPHLLDNAKEQYSGCAVQLPTTSLSALLTSMRSLNYLSANIQSLCQSQTLPSDDGLLSNQRIADFDIGELVQNIADLLGGQAAQKGVDLVLFHGDVGIKHVSVSGDAEGLGYVLSHILRQILLVSNQGDIIEIGLQLIPQSPSLTPKVALPLSASNVDRHVKDPESEFGNTLPPPSTDNQGPMLCVFEIIHNINQSIGSAAATPRAENNPFVNLAEAKEATTPKLDTMFCRRLLQHQRASLRQDIQPSSPLGAGMPRRAYEVSILLPRGKPILEPTPLSLEEAAARQPFATVKLAREPTLEELSAFAESLRGKKVSLHANLSSLFARHLTSYLGVWGLDISHIAIDDADETPAPTSRSGEGAFATLSAGDASALKDAKDADRFIMIDDDVDVLRIELTRLRAESTAFQLKPRLMKRPTLMGRARSTPHVRQYSPKPITPVLIHFTSLAKYNQVRDTVSSVLGPPWLNRDGAMAHPEVMVIPKPVGPRRFLTALHTAVNQPLVDPFFSPIATTPRSPGGDLFWGNARTPMGSDGPREGFFDSVAEEGESTAPIQKARSPLAEYPPPMTRGESQSIPTPGEVVATPASEYFSAMSKASMGSASGMVIQSPDGRIGIQFDPPAKGERRNSYQPPISARRKSTGRRTSGVMDPPSSTASPISSPQSARRQSNISAASSSDAAGPSNGRRPITRRVDSSSAPKKAASPPSAGPEKTVFPGRERSSTITRRSQGVAPASAASPKEATKKKAKEEVVVPPINVLIVEDNPINQKILSTFLKKKKIKHQSAKDGLEAVEKWRTGNFHLILMDIQLPVMDGIEATKEIRKLEMSNNIGVFPGTPLGEHRPEASAPGTPLQSSVIVVALTASSLMSDRVNALAAGCNDFLTKPVSLKWLERKIVEWGCMQALIDFDGWKRWKGVEPANSNETKRGFTLGPQRAARTVADRLKIERKPSPARSGPLRADNPNIHVQSATPPLQPAGLDSLVPESEGLSAIKEM